MVSFNGHRIPYSLVHGPISMNSQPITERMSASRRKARDLGQIGDPMSVLPSTLPIRSALIPSTSISKLDHHGCPFAKPVLWSCGLCKSMASKCQALISGFSLIYFEIIELQRVKVCRDILGFIELMEVESVINHLNMKGRLIFRGIHMRETSMRLV
jgi:hypothetical protein